MATTVHDLLSRIRDTAAGNRDLGTAFERLMVAYLQTDPQWTAQFSEVWTFAEAPLPPGIDRRDLGIDLVAADIETGGLCAIQCKFYEPGHTVDKAGIDSFFAASGKGGFTRRLIISTTEKWGPNAEAMLEGQQIPVSRIGMADLESGPVDWEALAADGSWKTGVAFDRSHFRRPRKELRRHQAEALEAVFDGFADRDRGKMIMACGTGKTFTSLKIAERLAAERAAAGHERTSVLFLVPSLSLLSQSLREWTAEATTPLRSFVVCSDAKASKHVAAADFGDQAVYDLAFPATTDPQTLAAQFARVEGEAGLTAVFATYHSLPVVAQAQAQARTTTNATHAHATNAETTDAGGIGAFDLVLCDEAHRTTGVTLSGEAESNFVRVHDAEYLQAAKRLYMTATPRVYAEQSKADAQTASAEVCSMDDEALFGPEFHRLGFGRAVELDLLTDYKVLILTVDEDYAATALQQQLADADMELRLADAAKIIGCWNGLSKRPANPNPNPNPNPDTALATGASAPDTTGGFAPGEAPMRRAVAFAADIASSKHLAKTFADVVTGLAARPHAEPSSDTDTDTDTDTDAEDVPVPLTSCEVRHVDGTMNALERNAELDWLRADPGPGAARILSNARCLSEGVDVPDLDAVLFLHPRNSVVDVVQSVGRVMRKAEGKDYGYIILPVAVPAGLAPEKALADNKRFKVVWQVLNALRTHDERFNAMVNQIDLNKNRPDRILTQHAAAADDELAAERTDPDPDTNAHGTGTGTGTGTNADPSDADTAEPGPSFEQEAIAGLLAMEQWQEAIYARIVQKVGERHYWEDWAVEIAQIAGSHVTRIKAAIALPGKREAFEAFVAALRANLNPGVSEDDAIDMLAQHLITKPVFDALFADYAFASHNPVSRAMEAMLAALEDQSLESEQETLEGFYKQVRVRAEGVDNHEGRQRIIKDLYETFFKTALPRTSDRLGIVYTPIEVVDFMLRAVDGALGTYFDASVSDAGVHVIDPFTGTGTFITRLLQSGLIRPEDLARKYTEELHANEIVLLAYYIAAVNVEAVFHTASGGAYRPFEGVVLTDTFQLAESDDARLFGVLEGNSERAKKQQATDIRVVVGNPPYSVGQGSQNDDNQNLKYPHLDERIAGTYAKRSTATNKNSLYDSYMRAFRWASDRIKDEGIVCFVSNGGYIDSNTADGLRKSFTDEFDAIYCYNLRGNQRTAGELSRKEGGKIFGSGSRNTVAVILLVKGGKAAALAREDDSGDGCRLFYRDIGDYLTRDQKLKIIAGQDLHSVEWQRLRPSPEGDWINQRDERFATFRPVGDKEKKPAITPIFEVYSAGLQTNRDAWVYNFSKQQLSNQVGSMIEFYNSQVSDFDAFCDANRITDRKDQVDDFISFDTGKIKWSRSLKGYLAKGETTAFDPDHVVQSMYRPFTKQATYFDRHLNHERGQLPRMFPTPQHDNLGFYITGTGSEEPFSVLMIEGIPDLHAVGTKSVGPHFPRYTYSATAEEGTLLAGSGASIDTGGFERIDNITDAALRDYRAAYTDASISKDDVFYYVYGLLHSAEYRTAFESDLKKSLPRIPKVADFHGFAEAGRRLAELHTGYETVEPYGGIEEEIKESAPSDAVERYRVERKMKFASRQDRSAIVYNSYVTLTGIPEETYRYQLGARSAVEWIIDRYYVKTDKASGIVNDPNEWSSNPRYIVDLMGRIVTVSLETMKIVDALPPLDLLPEQ